MKKTFGFTLAEVLITLGIIGVVAALTMPTFTTKTTTAKIGPQLAKAVSMFEQANKALLADYESDSLQGVVLSDGTRLLKNGKTYMTALESHLNGTQSGNYSFYAADGTFYSTSTKTFPSTTDVCLKDTGSNATSPNKCVIASSFYIDINGYNKSPNKWGRDRFRFKLFDDGTLAPWGAVGNLPRGDSDNKWTEKCKSNEVPADYQYCAGSIFDNGLTVQYK